VVHRLRADKALVTFNKPANAVRLILVGKRLQNLAEQTVANVGGFGHYGFLKPLPDLPIGPLDAE
jgi:hypothetical protein